MPYIPILYPCIYEYSDSDTETHHNLCVVNNAVGSDKYILVPAYDVKKF